MYIPKFYRVNDPKIIADSLRKNSFAVLVSCDKGLPIATHLPLEFVQLSQNRHAEDFANVMAKLRKSDDANAREVAEAMARIQPALFHEND